ncbi:MAG: UDP-N-acetylmuramoyl-L-alanyl-D-glutamate--2,6-diaminopimelate ligase [Leptospiraceae bacterium]|nr:MAG: UDP-N-acetylmuramoyl-L-alanyl-D-glutamate--2,6-diaminopimelate ligase [Leptospiraceae bacterium]
MKFREALIKLNKIFPAHLKIYQIKNNEHHMIQDWNELPDSEFNITDDSRNVNINTLFFSTFFAKSYLNDAILKHPFAIFVSKKELHKLLKDHKYNGFCIIGKKEPDFYLGYLSSIYYDYPSKDMYIVAITGTNGKTTISFMIYHLWKKKHIPCAVIGTLGVFYWNGSMEKHIYTGFTTPRAYELHQILDVLKKENIQHIVIEASSEALALRRLEGLNIQKAIFTNLGRDHLNFHKNLNAYFFAKLHLFFLTLRATKEKIPFVVVYNSNTYYLFYRFIQKTNAKILFLLQSHLNHNFVKYQPMPLLFNQFNALCAYYGITRNEEPLYKLSEKPLSDFKGVPGRVERLALTDSIDIIIDYAHTPDALENLLSELKNQYEFMVLVFGCGGNRDIEKRPLMGNIAANYCDYIFLTDDNPRNENPQKIRNDIKKGIPVNKYHILQEIGDRKLAIQNAIEYTFNIQKNSDKKSCIIIAGKGHENYQIIGNKKISYSDKEAVLELIKIISHPNEKKTLR